MATFNGIYFHNTYDKKYLIIRYNIYSLLCENNSSIEITNDPSSNHFLTYYMIKSNSILKINYSFSDVVAYFNLKNKSMIIYENNTAYPNIIKGVSSLSIREGVLE